MAIAIAIDFFFLIMIITSAPFGIDKKSQTGNRPEG